MPTRQEHKSMINYIAQANQHLSATYGDEFAILEESIVDLDQFYCFTYQSKEFVRTRNPSTRVAGQGYTILNKEDNRFFGFGSRHSLKEALKILEGNLLTEKRIRRHKPQFELTTRYDLQVNTIKKLQVLIDKLSAFEMRYVIPEVVGDSIFRIPRRYDKRLLKNKLMNLPVTFHDVVDILRITDELLTSDCCEFELLQHQEKNLAKYADKATEEDLQPIW